MGNAAYDFLLLWLGSGEGRVMSTSLYRQALVATLGTQPQVVTLALDLLEDDQGVVVDEVTVIHTEAQGRVGDALERLREQFRHNRYRGRRCAFEPVLIVTADERPVRDIRSEEDARSTFRTIFRTVQGRKKEGRIVHLSIAGGRNSMGAYGVVTAQILFGKDDRLWHIVSTEEFERSGKMHRRGPSDAVLTQIPVLYWSGVSPPVMAALAREDDPFRAIVAQQQWMERQTDVQREEFLTEVLTVAERRVVEDFVIRGGTDREIAARLARSLGRPYSGRTVNTHLGHIYGKMEDFFGYSLVNRGTVMQQFAGFFGRHPHLRILQTG
jgi:CRISPR-associated protein Csx14